MMDRRAFLGTLGLLAAPLAAEAQPAGKMPRIGFLSPSSPSDPRTHRFLEAFKQGLHALGWREAQNITIEYRWAEEKTERLPDLARQLVSLRVDVIVAATTPAILPAKQATATIPIVMAVAVDPVGTGIVPSIARPGGNITGLSLMAPELLGKQMQLVREVVPKVSRMAILWNPSNASNAPQLRNARDAARALKVQLQALEARGPAEIDSAFAVMTKERADAVIVLADAMLIAHRTRIADLAAKSRLPAMYGLTDHAAAGGLIAYGPNIADLYRRAAVYVDRILKGAKPADLPIEQPTKFELVINLKAAKALGLTIPPSLLARADQVIE
jgi:putative ABC transport system substrate-binding protein